MKNPPNVNFDIRAIRGETCPFCDEFLVLGMNHPLVEVDGKVSHLRCAFIDLTENYPFTRKSKWNVCPDCGDEDCF